MQSDCFVGSVFNPAGCLSLLLARAWSKLVSGLGLGNHTFEAFTRKWVDIGSHPIRSQAQILKFGFLSVKLRFEWCCPNRSKV